MSTISHSLQVIPMSDVKVGDRFPSKLHEAQNDYYEVMSVEHKRHEVVILATYVMEGSRSLTRFRLVKNPTSRERIFVKH